MVHPIHDCPLISYADLADTSGCLHVGNQLLHTCVGSTYFPVLQLSEDGIGLAPVVKTIRRRAVTPSGHSLHAHHCEHVSAMSIRQGTLLSLCVYAALHVGSSDVL
jgi:hypothetical protein